MLLSIELPDIRTQTVLGKRILLRLDLDVPFVGNDILDDTRLKAGLLSINYLLEHGAKVTVIGHRGRPNGKDENFSLKPIAEWFGRNINNQKLNIKNSTREGFDGWEIGEDVFIVENVRFFKGEEKNSSEFVRDLARLGELFVNDAFAVSHRNHASTVGIAKVLPHFAGVHFFEEIKVLSGIINNPKRPFTVLIGGGKIETKLPLLEKMHHFADYVLVGGKIAQETGELLRLQHEKLGGIKSILLVAELNGDGVDITEKSVENFLQVIKISQTVIWNGPVGKTEDEQAQKGSKRIAEGIVEIGLHSVVGGGDTVGFLDSIGLLNKFSFVSTGGGAMLAFLSGETLPAVAALQNN